MCNVTMPAFDAIKKPFESREFTADELKFIEASKSNFAAGKVPSDIVGNSDAPDSGPVTYADPDKDNPPPEGPGWAALERIISSDLSASSSWKETGNNPKIIACLAHVGLKSSSDQPPWCAAYASKKLSEAGLESIKSASSQSFRKYGSEVGVVDWARVRKNDIVVLSYGGGSGHVGFYRGYDQTRNMILLAGGNQSNTVKLSSFPAGQIASIKRNWTIPSQYDKPLYVTATGQATTFKQTR